MTKEEFEVVHPTEKEKRSIWRQNFKDWGGDLTEQQYIDREIRGQKFPLTQKGGIQFFILVSPSQKNEDGTRKVLSYCEYIVKPAIVNYADGRLEEVNSYALGSVFTPTDCRKKGHAKTMLKLLGQKIDRDVRTGLKNIPFTVLYSDVGKEFYSRLGWHPHESHHLHLPPMAGPQFSTSHNYIDAMALQDLCVIDIAHIKTLVSQPLPSNVSARISFLPTSYVLDWHEQRSNYVSMIKSGKSSCLHGLQTTDGRMWIVWTHWVSNRHRKLVILRFVDLDEGQVLDSASEAKRRENVKLLLKGAQREAYDWDLAKGVEMWNPTPLVREVAAEIQGSSVVERHQSSIPSLRWHPRNQSEVGVGVDEGKEIRWVNNEFYSWC
ncbi:hypothetical protein BJ508DRAFT_333181 [Ascobolus immersus RN42]|uniref:LYC1 C-terminal domain-containing protein n=1 Tax=Ascobolus immersus RN42 TaxID=1160509 RepID=A0A3N4HKE7_ASCIM|nr:hypothetical protein BJ508DRAFT_333181 [Ascobolus immersus RN42]